MTAGLRAVPTLARIGFASMVAYRAELVIWILTASLPLVMLALWNAVAADGPIVGFGQAELARYFAAALVVRQLTGCWIVWELNYDIRTGALSPKLLRPINPLWVEVWTTWAAIPFRVLVLLPIVGALLLWRPELWASPSAASLALFALTVTFAWTLAFLVQACFGLLAFWFDQSLGLFGVWFAAWSLLSGYIAPLAVFPESMQPILRWLPFRGMLALPVELLGGFVTPSQALPDVGIQLGWVVVLGALALTLWRRGLQRYGAFGA